MDFTNWLRCLWLALSCAAADAAAVDTAAAPTKNEAVDVVLQAGTGLRWTRSDSEETNLADAKAHCDRLGAGWRLPSLDELNGLYAAAREAGQTTPCGDAVCTAPPQLKLHGAWHWSGTPATQEQARDHDELTWGQTLVNGRATMALHAWPNGARALCVRGA
jgi:hypothetical protein